MADQLAQAAFQFGLALTSIIQPLLQNVKLLASDLQCIVQLIGDLKVSDSITLFKYKDSQNENRAEQRDEMNEKKTKEC